MSVAERTKEIGILSAVGWQRSRIVTMVMIEGLVLAVIGSIVGLTIGIAGLHWIAHSPQTQGFIEFVITKQMVIEVFVAAIVLGLSGSAYPAWRASSFRPVEAIRYE